MKHQWEKLRADRLRTLSLGQLLMQRAPLECRCTSCVGTVQAQGKRWHGAKESTRDGHVGLFLLPFQNSINTWALGLEAETWLGIPARHIRVSGLNSSPPLPIPASCGCTPGGQQVVAQARGCLPPTWDFQTELLTPGSGLTQPWLLWDLGRN